MRILPPNVSFDKDISSYIPTTYFGKWNKRNILVMLETELKVKPLDK